MARLYISGPVTGIENDNRAAFEEAKRRLSAKHPEVNIPHHFIASGTPYPKAMRISLSRVTSGVYYGVALLAGWENSNGALLEKQVAEACGIPCKTVDEWLEEAR
ncbi:DUF4406 domain-containing protein [Adlercreutzia sp. R25]|uniref:DUF4406 domain-containing protein n=1 Tax=Adlercreutzia shanghongiae TaxID=3111773 RepID=UPI002DBA0D83|nr:DUF4406 domain-containing protein [Adlercreutzia sp. R25]MEC4272938.1 DUF4406 domain-containing protein [Adlercreutzia sp. R25]